MHQNAIFTTFDSQSFDQSKEGTSLPFQATGGVDPSGCCTRPSVIRHLHRKDSRWCFGVREWIHRSASSLRVDDTAYRPGSQEELFPLGSPPRMQTRDLRNLPGGYGMGSGTGPLDSGKYQS